MRHFCIISKHCIQTKSSIDDGPFWAFLLGYFGLLRYLLCQRCLLCIKQIEFVHFCVVVDDYHLVESICILVRLYNHQIKQKREDRLATTAIKALCFQWLFVQIRFLQSTVGQESNICPIPKKACIVNATFFKNSISRNPNVEPNFF